APRRVRVLREDLLPGAGRVARTGMDRRAVALHQQAAIGLLVVAHLDHVDGAVETEEAAGHREGAAPLAGAGLGRESPDAFLLVVVRLGDGGVRLVAADRAHALVLVVDPGRRLEVLLQAKGAMQRRRPPELVDVAHLVRDVDPAVGAHFLLDDLYR